MNKILLRNLAIMALLSFACVAMAFTSQQDDRNVSGSAQMITRLNGSYSLLGTLTSSGATVNNSNTAVPFTIPKGSALMIQCSADSYVLNGTANSVTASSTTAVKILQDEKFYMILTSAEAYVAEIPVSGSNTCKIFRMQ